MLVNAAHRQDPTKPSRAVAHQLATTGQVSIRDKLVLNAIKLDGKYKIAIINKKTYGQGQKIGQDRIKKIMSNKVVLSSGTTLFLFGQSVVKISN